MADTPSSPAEPRRDDSYDVCSDCRHSRWLHVSVARNGGCMAKSVRGAPNCGCPAFADPAAPSSSGEPAANVTSSNSADPFNEPHVNYVRVGNCSGPGCVVTSTHAPPSSIPPCPRCEGAGTIPCPGPESPDWRDAEIARLKEQLGEAEWAARLNADSLRQATDARQAAAAECARLRAEVERHKNALGHATHSLAKILRTRHDDDVFGAHQDCWHEASIALGMVEVALSRQEPDAAATPPAGDARGI